MSKRRKSNNSVVGKSRTFLDSDEEAEFSDDEDDYEEEEGEDGGDKDEEEDWEEGEIKENHREKKMILQSSTPSSKINNVHSGSVKKARASVATTVRNKNFMKLLRK